MKPAGGMIKVAPIYIDKSSSAIHTNEKPELSSMGKIIELGPDVTGFTVGQVIVFNPKKLTIASENGVNVGYIHSDLIDAIYE
jgi:hypothetical protein